MNTSKNQITKLNPPCLTLLMPLNQQKILIPIGNFNTLGLNVHSLNTQTSK